MANPLHIYSGPGDIGIFDSTNGSMVLGYSKEINVSGEPQSHELLDGNLHQYTTLYKLEADLLQSDQDLITDLTDRRSVKQKVVVTGFESKFEINNVFPVLNAKRPFKAGEPHTIGLIVQTAVENDVVMYENLLGDDGDFNEDSNGDDLADGWVDDGLSDYELVPSFISGGSSAQHIETAASEGGIYYEVFLPFKTPRQLSFFVYMHETSASHSLTGNIIIEVLDDTKTVLQSYSQSFNIAAGGTEKVSLSQNVDLVDTGDSVHFVRAKIMLDQYMEVDLDHAQLELGSETSYKNY